MPKQQTANLFNGPKYHCTGNILANKFGFSMLTKVNVLDPKPFLVSCGLHKRAHACPNLVNRLTFDQLYPSPSLTPQTPFQIRTPKSAQNYLWKLQRTTRAIKATSRPRKTQDDVSGLHKVLSSHWQV